jgi:hypothetical protein
MRRARGIIVLLAALTLLAGCGGGAAGGTTAAATSTTAGTTAGTTPGATATTQTTTTTTATTLPADAHPVYGASWAAVWPPDGAEATYHALTYDNEWVEVPARIDYGVDWEGGTWDRITVGTADFGGTGAAFYFDRSQPWVLRIWGVESFFPDMPTGQVQREWFEEPLVVDLSQLPGTTPELQDTLNLSFFRDSEPEDQFDWTAQVEVLGVETLEVPAGTVQEALHVRFTVGGDLTGGGGFHSDLWVHPDLFLLKWEETLGFMTIELAAPFE